VFGHETIDADEPVLPAGRVRLGACPAFALERRVMIGGADMSGIEEDRAGRLTVVGALWPDNHVSMRRSPHPPLTGRQGVV